MYRHPRRTDRPYVNGLAWTTLGRFLSWLALSIPLAIVALGAAPSLDAPSLDAPSLDAPSLDAPTPDATIAAADSAQASVFGGVDRAFDHDADPGEPGPPWPVATFLGDNIVDFSGYASDLFVFGQMVTVGGDVQGNAFVCGQIAEFEDGHVGGDLFVIGESITIKQGLGADLYLAGPHCRIQRDAEIRGNVYAGCGQLVIEGVIGGSIVGMGGEVILDGPVGGDVDIEVGSLSLGPSADIAGDLRYASADEAEVDGDAVVGGAVDFTMAEQWDDDDHFKHDGCNGPGLLGFFLKHTWAFLSALVVGFVLLVLLGDRFRRPINPLLDQPGKSLGIGFVALVCVPVAALIAIALIVTLPLGVIGLVLYAVAVYLAALLPALALGRLILQRSFGKDDPSPYASMALGLLILHLLFAIPFFGFLIHLVVACAGLGAIYLMSAAGPPDATET